MKDTIILIYFVIIYASSGVTSDSLTKTNHIEMSDTLDCKTCTLIVEKIESNLDVDFFSHMEEFKNVIENISPFCNALRRSSQISIAIFWVNFQIQRNLLVDI